MTDFLTRKRKTELLSYLLWLLKIQRGLTFEQCEVLMKRVARFAKPDMEIIRTAEWSPPLLAEMDADRLVNQLNMQNFIASLEAKAVKEHGQVH